MLIKVCLYLFLFVYKHMHIVKYFLLFFCAMLTSELNLSEFNFCFYITRKYNLQKLKLQLFLLDFTLFFLANFRKFFKYVTPLPSVGFFGRLCF